MQPQIRRQHRMPFGAQLTAAGEVRFRLWAPAARQVDVILYDSGGTQPLAMRSLPGGWFELETAAARAGSRYRYRLDGVREVADPASRCNPEGVHGPSEVIDPCAFAWDDALWRAPPWPEAVIYELHVGAFSPEGTFAGVAARLEHLAQLGVTAVELMPVHHHAYDRHLEQKGLTNYWGYNTIGFFAPEWSYSTRAFPGCQVAEFKTLVRELHRAGIEVILDVVYNHSGEGNEL